MNAPLTHYVVLGLEPDATQKEIDAAHRKGMRATHPDMAQGASAAHLFILVQAAYEVLGDKDKRAEYDEMLAGGSSSASNDSSGTSTPEAPPEPSWGEETTWEEPVKSEWERERERKFEEYLNNRGNPPPAATPPPTAPRAAPFYDPSGMQFIRTNINDLAGGRLSSTEKLLPGKKKSKSTLGVIGIILTLLGHFVLPILDALESSGGVLVLASFFFLFYWLSMRRAAFKRKYGWFVLFSLVPIFLTLVGLPAIITGDFWLGMMFSSLFTFAFVGMVLWMKSLQSMHEGMQPEGGSNSVLPLELTQERVLGAHALAHRLGVNVNSVDFMSMRATADVMNSLSEIPGIRVIHGVATQNSVVHHAVVSGSKVAVINSAFWGSGDFAFDANGTVTRDHNPTPTLAVTIPAAVADMRTWKTGKLKKAGFKVRGWTLLQASTGDMTYTSQKPGEPTLALPAVCFQEVLTWLLEDNEEAVVDRRVLGALASRANILL